MTEVRQEIVQTEEQLCADRLRAMAESFSAAAQSDYPSQIGFLASLLGDAFENGRKLLVFGNGGSSADAQHLCGELVVRFQVNRRALPAVALGPDTAVMTACGNDFSYEEVFGRQVEALAVPGDIILGISTSGTSPNVICGLKAGAEKGATTVMLTGSSRRVASPFIDHVIAAPATTTARIQELHLAAYHILCELIETRITRN